MNIITQDIRQRGIEKVNSWRKDWGKFAREGLGVNLDREQEDVIYSVQHNPKTSVKSGTARGKDYVAAACCMSFFYLTPRFDPLTKELIGNTKVALTAPTDRQVKNIMMPEISRMFYSAKRNSLDIPGILTSYGIRTIYDEWFLTGFKADEHNHEAWSGFHAVNVMFTVTEASGIAQSIFDAIEGNLQGNSRLLIVFNDNTGTGYAAASQKKQGWAKFRLDSLNAPNVKEKKNLIPGQVDWNWVDQRVKEWCQVIPKSGMLESEGDFEWEGLYYRPNDLFRVKVRGMAPKVSSDILVQPNWIDLATERWKAYKGGNRQSLRLGVDVAGMGRDSSSFCFRFGNYVEKFRVIQSGGVANHMEVAGITYAEMKNLYSVPENSYPQAFIDTVGEGGGVYSRMEEIKREDPIMAQLNVYSIKGGYAAKKGDRPLKDLTGQYEFKNLRSYLFWAVRDWLNPDNKTGAMLPPDHDYSGLTELKWNMRSDGTIEMEAKEDLKKRIKRSPDVEDSLAMTFYPVSDIERKPSEGKKKLSGFF